MLRIVLRQLVGLPMEFNVKNLPGKPDIVIHDLKLAVFVEGCFWHGCPEHGKIPKSHQGYWRSKIVGNMIRDEEITVVLEEQGWTVWRIWEHDLRPDSVVKTRRKLSKRVAKLMAS
jgi:DNA mismatch endonuclease (patch repair protein)